ncbi:MAG TPA: ATP-binding protein [Bryobacteraceae bacterium]|nr:ATP-binding protein [Bryobacteraceae bacterium]
MNPDPVTYKKLQRVLVLGFSAVIVLLVAAAFVGVNSAQLIKESTAELVRSELVTTRLIEELQREQDTLNTTFYRLSRGPELVDRARSLAQLDAADQAVGRIVQEAAGTPQAKLWRQLDTATREFSSEARRLLALHNVPNYSSRDLLRRNEEVTGLVAKLISSNYNRAIAAQSRIDQRSSRLVNESVLLLGGCLLLALLCAIFTVRITAVLFRKMGSQASDLTRVTWHMLENQETVARRFSHELHDELGQSLTAIKANLLALDSNNHPDPSRLEDCKHLVDEAVQNVREMSQLLRPTILDDFGLDAGIRWQTERFAQRTGIVVNYHSTFEDRLPDEAETHLFRIVQEALTNVARHSGATRLDIELQREGDRIHLRMQDNGRGFKNGNPPGGLGLVGMHARASSIGGELSIQSRDGVAIELWAPCGMLQTESG